MNYAYDPSIFDCPTIEAAKQVILWPGEGVSSDERWETETPFLLSLLEDIALTAGSWVLDYGCGIGRLSKELIARTGCHVLGVDISANMRGLAACYVGSERFIACAPQMLDCFRGFDLALSVWVLQHCRHPHEDIQRISRALKPDSDLLVVNNLARAVPSAQGWIDDGIDLGAVLDAAFDKGRSGKLSGAPPRLTANTFWARYRRR